MLVLPLLNQRACYLRCSAAIWDKHYLAQLWFCSDKAGLIKLDLIGIAFKHSTQQNRYFDFKVALGKDSRKKEKQRAREQN